MKKIFNYAIRMVLFKKKKEQFRKGAIGIFMKGHLAFPFFAQDRMFSVALQLKTY